MYGQARGLGPHLQATHHQVQMLSGRCIDSSFCDLSSDPQTARRSLITVKLNTDWHRAGEYFLEIQLVFGLPCDYVSSVALYVLEL